VKGERLIMQTERKRILLFEEDFESMRDVKEHLEETLRWHVELTAEKAILERLSRERFDLIVVDVMIRPKSLDAEGEEVHNVHFDGVNWRGTGIEFLRRLRSGEYSGAGPGTSPDVPVLVLTAAGDHSELEELAKEVQFYGYIEKPFRLQELVKRIHTLLKE
jgi:CheY-like chemotaxis protein